MFEPVSAADRHAWLFDQRAIDAFERDEEDNYTDSQRRLNAAQDAALVEVVDEVGVDGLAAWADARSNPEFSSRQIGDALARVRPGDSDVLALVADPDETAQRIAVGYVSLTARREGFGWAESVLSTSAPGRGRQRCPPFSSGRCPPDPTCGGWPTLRDPRSLGHTGKPSTPSRCPLRTSPHSTRPVG